MLRQSDIEVLNFWKISSDRLYRLFPMFIEGWRLLYRVEGEKRVQLHMLGERNEMESILRKIWYQRGGKGVQLDKLGEE